MPIQLFWKNLQSTFSEQNSQTKFISVGRLLQTVTFNLPIHLDSLSTLRLDPGKEDGNFSVINIDVLATRDNKPVKLQSLTPETFGNRERIQFNNIRLGWGYFKYSLLSLNNDPYLCWSLPPIGKCPELSHVQVRIRMQWLGKIDNGALGIIRLPSMVQNWLLSSQLSSAIRRRRRFLPWRRN